MKPLDPALTGLCATCRHRRVVPTPRSAFVLCERSREDTRFPRYPRLPVRQCAGFESSETPANDA